MNYERSTRTTEDTVDAEVISSTVSPRPNIALGDRKPLAPGTTGPVGRLRAGMAGWRIPKPPFYLMSFVMLVVIPSLVVQIYLGFIASDQYVASARFAVRSVQESARDGVSALSAASQGTGLTQASMVGQDAHIVVSYIHSRAIIDDLSGRIDIRAIFSRPEADLWARLRDNPTAEQLSDYWQSMVTTNVDGPSGIVTVYARAFRPKDALDLTRAIVAASEKLANDVSERARRDTMSRAELEVKRSEGLVRAALADMRQLREKVGFIDPVASATMTGKLIAQAMAEKIRLENEMFVATRVMSANAPALNNLALRLQAINDQIDRLKATLTSDVKGDSPISKALVAFEEVELKRTFAEKLYVLAQDALERARLSAEKQNIYVDVFVPPLHPRGSALSGAPQPVGGRAARARGGVGHFRAAVRRDRGSSHMTPQPRHPTGAAAMRTPLPTPDNRHRQA